MNLSKKQIIIVGAVGLFVVVVLALLVLGGKPSTGLAPQLTVWGLDKHDVFDTFATAYKQALPGALLTYTQISPKDYEGTLLKALAAGKGPDIFYLPNHSLPKFKDALAPIDPKKFTTVNFSDKFPTVAADDFIYKGQAYAAPLYIDTLALIYNRDMLDGASVATPPSTWADFQELVPKLRVINETGQITRAAAALGGTNKTVSHSSDLLSLLMLQNGTQMVSSDLSSAIFGSTSQGPAALTFYLQFSNPASQTYTWNEAQQSSLDSFAAEKTAMVFGYKSDLDLIKAKNPYLHFGVGAMPQVSVQNSVNYANYMGLGVSVQSKRVADAWDLIIFLTTADVNAESFLRANGHPPALRSLIAQNANDVDFGVFAKQALSARSWYIVDYNKVDDVLNTAIARVMSGQSDPVRAIREAQDSVSLLMRQ